MAKRNETLKQRVVLATRALEKQFGVPNVRRRGDLIGSFVVTMLSQHTSDLNADRAFASLKNRFPRWSDVADAPGREITEAVHSAGLANQKGPRIREFARWVKRTFGDYDLSPIRKMSNAEIYELFGQVNGIGVKTISVVLLFSLGRQVFPVDTHVHRICRRVGFVPQKAMAEQTHRLMEPLIPQEKAMSLHVNMLRLGRTICVARKPKCPICPLNKLCDYGRREMSRLAKTKGEANGPFGS